MPRKSTQVSTAPTKNPTAQEMREQYTQNKDVIENYSKAAQSLKTLRNVNKASTTTIPVFSKESLRTYLQNISSNEKNLRNLSRYLYYRCHAYYRLIMYNATMFCLDARSVIPTYNLKKSNSASKVLKSYNDTLDVLDHLGLQREMLKAYIQCFVEDIFFGCVYYDDTGMFILPLPTDYCRISGIYQTGDFSFAMDMSYFRSRQELLELWGDPFTSMYRAYESDTTNGRWQPMPDEYAICMKQRFETWDTVIVPFSGLLNSIINLIDVEDVQAIADKQDIYKMIWLEMETITGSKQADDWKVDPDMMIEYFNRMLDEALPDYVSAAIIPGKLNTISFSESDKVNDTNKVSKATSALFGSSGGSQILDATKISGTEAFKAAIKADTEFAISSLLPQTEAWVNRFLSYQVSNNARVKFFEVSVYTKDWFKESLRQDAEYGLPVKMALNTLNGFSEKDTLALAYLENEVLHLSDSWEPLQSSHTTSNVGKGGTSTDGTSKVVKEAPAETDEGGDEV